MTRPLSIDLRERLILAVEGGMSWRFAGGGGDSFSQRNAPRHRLRHLLQPAEGEIATALEEVGAGAGTGLRGAAHAPGIREVVQTAAAHGESRGHASALRSRQRVWSLSVAERALHGGFEGLLDCLKRPTPDRARPARVHAGSSACWRARRKVSMSTACRTCSGSPACRSWPACRKPSGGRTVDGGGAERPMVRLLMID